MNGYGACSLVCLPLFRPERNAAFSDKVLEGLEARDMGDRLAEIVEPCRDVVEKT